MNTWKDYLIELLIVIIGITVAFSLNNIAESAKDRDTELKYIQDVRSDLVRDSVNLDHSLRFNQSKIKRLEEIITLIGSDSDMKYQDSLFQSIGIVGTYNFFYPESFTINSLLQSGDFKMIRSDQIKKDILKLRWRYELIDRDQNNFTKAMDDNYYPKILAIVDMSSGEVTDPAFFYSIQFKNWMLYVYNDTNNLVRNYTRSKRQIRSIIKAIDGKE